MSDDAKDLIQKVLTIDPEKRYKFEDIKAHKWFNLYIRNYAIPPGIIIGYNRIPIDYNILRELENYGFN